MFKNVFTISKPGDKFNLPKNTICIVIRGSTSQVSYCWWNNKGVFVNGRPDEASAIAINLTNQNPSLQRLLFEMRGKLDNCVLSWPDSDEWK